MENQRYPFGRPHLFKQIDERVYAILRDHSFHILAIARYKRQYLGVSVTLYLLIKILSGQKFITYAYPFHLWNASEKCLHTRQKSGMRILMTPFTPPGETREKVYRFVRRRIIEELPPTVREVQEAFRFRAVQTARQHLERLVTEGRLVKAQGKSRGYRLPREPGTLFVPLLGRVQAGGLRAAIEECEGYLPVQSRGSEEMFGLRVQGESMTGAGILPGDIVVVRQQAEAASGDIVVALVGDEATIKKLRLRRNRIELHPENPAFAPIIPRTDECTLLGKVVEVRRYLEG